MLWDSRHPLVKLGEHCCLVRRLNYPLVAGHDKYKNRSQWCGEAHLEASTGRNQPSLLQLREYRIGRFGCIGIAEALKESE